MMPCQLGLNEGKKREAWKKILSGLRPGEGCFILVSIGRFISLQDLVPEVKCFLLQLGLSAGARPSSAGQKMEHFCLHILLIHLPGDERARKNVFAGDSSFAFPPKEAKGIKNSAKCRKDD